jgi:site-specific DNA-cytosine methylase
MPKFNVKPKLNVSHKKALSLFSGMGGDSLGIVNSGWELIAYSEKDKIFRQTHDLNFDCNLLGNGDITKTLDSDFEKYRGIVNLIFAGFPCQGFSNAGKKQADDPRNTLFKEFIRATRLIRPDYIIGENVMGLQTKYTITDDSIIDFNNLVNVIDVKHYLEKYHLTSLFPKMYTLVSTNVYDIQELLSELTILKKKLLDTTKELKILCNTLYGEVSHFVKDVKKNEYSILSYKSSNISPSIDILYDKYDHFKEKKNCLEQIQHYYDILKISYIDIIKQSFENIGYKIKYKVLKTEEYGIPQERRRLIIVGIKNTIKKEYNFPSKIDTKPHLKDIVTFNMTGSIKINKDDFDMTQIPNECILTDMSNDENKTSECNYKPHPNLKLLAKDKDYVYNGITYPTRLSFGKRESSIHGEIIDIRNPSKTIICTYARQPRLFVPLKNKNGYYLRCLLPFELKQIQGFPEDYKLVGNTSQQIVQIGNAVPPPLITMVIQKLI